MHQLTGGDNGRAAILSLTISRQGGDVKTEEISRIVSLFRRMHEEGVITDGGAATERGGRKGNLHLQCSFWLPTLNRNAAEVQSAISTLVCEFAEFTGSDRHVHAVVQPANEPHVTWRTQCGYDCHVFNNASLLALSFFRSCVIDVTLLHYSHRPETSYR
jgi:hypothetical protein